MEKYISPNRIICEEKTENSYRLLRNKTLQAGFNNDECTKITTNGYVVLDFGKELSGGAVLCIQDVSCAPHTAKCRLVFGESVMETLSTLGEKNATNNHSIRDAVIDVTTMSTTKFGATGFRFLKIEAMDSDIVLKSVMAETDIIELEYKGSFECSNGLLNKIWKMGAYTVQLNIHEYVWDGVKRDRLVWVGDMHPEVAVIKTVFGRIEAVEKSLDFVKDETSPDSWMNCMPAYSMWWIIIHYEWYMYVGDIDYLRKQEEYLTVLTINSMKWIDEDFYTNGGYFVDWSSAQTPAAADGIRSMFCMGLDAASKIFRILGNYERSEECRKYVKKLRTESYTADLNMSMAGINVLSGRNTKSARKILAESGTNGMSCFIGYYTLQAMASMGLCNEALYLMKEYWGAE